MAAKPLIQERIGISANRLPQDLDIISLFESLTEGNNPPLILLKDHDGWFYLPNFGFNSIANWVYTQGYLAKLSRDVKFVIEGDFIDIDDPMQLREHWQILPYFPNWELDVETALASIVDDINLVKNQDGQIYNPRIQFNNMDNLQPGQGYKVKMNAESTLIYPAEEPDEVNSKIISRPSHFMSPRSTGNNISIIVHSDEFTSGQLAAFNPAGMLTESGSFNHKG